MNFMTGMWKPSSNTSRGSTERTLPPMSGACAVEAANATMRPLRKIGLATVMSLRCPVAIHGVLVTSTSPGAMLSSPISLMNAFTVTGSVPMNEGMLSVFCASDCPAASVSTQAKSLDSFTSVENDVRLQRLGRLVHRRDRAPPQDLQRDGVEGVVALVLAMFATWCPSKQSFPAWSTLGAGLHLIVHGAIVHGMGDA